MKIQVSFPIYVIGFMSFISWFLFVLFGGIGLAAVPLDMIYSFATRPRKLTAKELEFQTNKIVQDAIYFKGVANEIKGMEERGVKKKTSKLDLI